MSEASFALESRCRIVTQVYGVSRDVMLAWFDAARAGRLKALRQLYRNVTASNITTAAADAAPQHPLVHATGEGTSYGFVGSTALHWAAANGDAAMLRQLLEWGAAVNAQNKGGSTPLHSACAHLRLDTASLLLQHGANADVADCCNDTPADLLVAMTPALSSSSVELRNQILSLLRLHSLAKQLIEQRARHAAARGGASCCWDVASMKRLVVGCGMFARDEECPMERSELAAACASALDQFLARVHTAATSDAAFERLRAEFDEAVAQRAARLEAKSRAAASSRGQQEEDDDDDDDAAELAEAQLLAAKAKQTSDKGNAAFGSNDFKLAVQLYTAAISLNPRDATFFSNRSAAYLKMRVPKKALDDAKTAAQLRPDWAKPYHRWGCAALELGQLNDAVAAFRLGLERAPQDASLLQGLQDTLDALIERQGTASASGAKGQTKPQQRDDDDDDDDDEDETPRTRSEQERRPQAAAPKQFVPLEQRHPWFTCVLCENRTRDAAQSPCCSALVCGTCRSRRFGAACPLKCGKK